MSGFAIRKGRSGDLVRLVEIEEAAFDTDLLSARSFAHALKSAASELLVAEADERVVGYCLVNFRRGSQKARLFSLARDSHARGAGRALLAAAEKAAQKRGCVALRLEVRETNLRAIEIYERSGYRRIGREESYYEDGAPALRLEKALSNAR